MCIHPRLPIDGNCDYGQLPLRQLRLRQGRGVLPLAPGRRRRLLLQLLIAIITTININRIAIITTINRIAIITTINRTGGAAAAAW